MQKTMTINAVDEMAIRVAMARAEIHTMVELARRTGITKGYLNRIIKGTENMPKTSLKRMQTISKIANVLGISPDDVMGNHDDDGDGK